MLCRVSLLVFTDAAGIFRINYVGGSSILCDISNEMYFGSWTFQLVNVSEVQMVACRYPVVFDHSIKETHKCCRFLSYSSRDSVCLKHFCCRDGGRSLKTLSGAATSTMDVLIYLTSLPSCSNSLVGLNTLTIGMEPPQCMTFLPGSFL